MIPLKPAEEEPEDDAPKDATALQIEHDTLQEVMFYSSICDQHSSISWIQATLWGKKEKKWGEIAKWWTGARKDCAALSPPQTASWLALLADLFSHFSPNAEPSPRLTASCLCKLMYRPLLDPDLEIRQGWQSSTP